MTIFTSAIRTDPPRILIGADSRAVAIDLASGHYSVVQSAPYSKFYAIPDKPLGFGVIGWAPSPDFGDWMKKQPWRTWDEVEKSVGAKVATMNGERRRRAEQARVDLIKGFVPEGGFRVVVAGYLDGPRVLDVTDTGAAHGYREGNDFHGLYEGATRLAYQVLADHGVMFDPSAPKEIDDYLRVLGPRLPEHLHPMEYWTITPGSGVVPVPMDRG